MSLLPWKKSQSIPATAQMSPSISPFQQDMQRMFDRFFGRSFPMTSFSGFESFSNYPAINCSDSGDAVIVRAEVPGLEPGDVEISVEGNMLILRGEKREEHRDEKENCFYMERSYGSFMRRIELPSNVDTNAAEAHLEKGILNLRLPKVAGEASRTIKVQSS